MKKMVLVLSCEHAVNTIPSVYKPLFSSYDVALNSHQGVDFGALEVALHLQKALNLELVVATTSRLLIDCNRSLTNPKCFSEITRKLPLEDKQRLINQYYLPFRQEVITLIENHIKEGYQVLHLSLHSFTPKLNGLVRNTELGLLYDPKRLSEKLLVKRWQKSLSSQYKVRLNYPYRGTSDGFTASLRRCWPDADYLGIEFELNQTLAFEVSALATLSEVLFFSLESLLR